jgi:hypothetical protein
MPLLMLLALLFAQNATDVAVPVTLVGRITVDDGSLVPTVQTFRGPNIVFGLVATLPDGPNQLAEATTNAAGGFTLTVMTATGNGSFGVRPVRLPLGLYIKSIRYGSVDLLRGPLTIDRNKATDEIQIVLTKTPPAGANSGFKFSGRVTKLENVTSGTSLMINMQTTSGGDNVLRLGLFPVKSDGTFEISGVPAGQYLVRNQTLQANMNSLLDFTVADQDKTGVEIALASPGTQSLLITSVPMSPFPSVSMLPPPGSLSTIPQSAAPPTPVAGSAVVSVSQTVNQLGRKYYEGAIAIYRIEHAGQILEERRLDGAPLRFTLAPGDYELSGYFRGCDGNCGRVDAPEIFCSTPISVKAGDVLYAERVVQGTACTIRIYLP